MPADVWRFGIAVVVQWWGVTLAILTLLGIIDYFFGWRIGWRKFVHAGLALLIVGAFFAWREERHGRMAAERQSQAAVTPPLDDRPMSEQCGVPSRASIAPCSRPLDATPEDIWNDGKARSAFEQENGAAWEKYIHSCVRWTLPLKSLVSKGDIFEIHFAAGRIGLLTVAARVRADEYPDLRLIKDGARLNVEGRIDSVRLAFIGLYDATVTVAPEP